ncbi:MAG: ADP-ribosylglycohydrolase family protein [Lachnospiraceae bacterium]
MDKQTIMLGVYGLLIGDAMGVPYEFHAAEEIPEWDSIDFVPLAQFERSYADVLPGTWSDDGAQALCLLDSLLSCGRLEIDDLAERLLDWVDSGLWAVDGRVFDCGIQTMSSLRTYASGTSPLESGFVVPNGKGNGSLMRVLPLALWHEGTDSELVEDAHTQSLITHGHVCNQVCCALYCLWCRYILQGDDVVTAYQRAVDYLEQYYADRDDYLYELECCTAEGEASGTGYVVDSIRSTLHLLKTYKSYGDVIKGAISLGNDTDTTAAIAGGLAAVAYRDIPEVWIQRLRGSELLKELFQRL